MRLALDVGTVDERDLARVKVHRRHVPGARVARVERLGPVVDRHAEGGVLTELDVTPLLERDWIELDEASARRKGRAGRGNPQRAVVARGRELVEAGVHLLLALHDRRPLLRGERAAARCHGGGEQDGQSGGFESRLPENIQTSGDCCAHGAPPRSSVD